MSESIEALAERVHRERQRQDAAARAEERIIDQPEIEHLDGTPWHAAPRPFRFHLCWAQSNGWIRDFTYVERCACGAIRGSRDWRWTGKNSRH